MEPLVNDYCSHESGDDTALVTACRNGQFSIVERLTLMHDFNFSNENIINAAAASGNLEIFTLLLRVSRSASVYPDFSVKRRGYRPLIHASANGHESIVELLCQEGVRINAKDEYNNNNLSALSAAASSGQDHIVRLLLAKGARILTTGTTPLHCAADKGHDVVVRTILEADAEYDHQGRWNRDPYLKLHLFLIYKLCTQANCKLGPSHIVSICKL